VIKAVPAKQRDSAAQAEGSPSQPVGAERELFRLALLRQQVGDHKVASELYHKVLALNPRNAAALNNMGVILKEMGRLTEAGELLKKAIDLDPSYDKAHTNLGVVLQLEQQTQAAIEAHLRSLAINERSWESAVNLGLLFWSEGDLESAKRFFFKALGIRHEASVLHHLGVIFEQQGQRLEAIRHYRQALQKGDGLTPQLREKIQLRLRELLGGEGAKSPGTQR
jgi:tetratricopeptide (TPR) repeat protein